MRDGETWLICRCFLAAARLQDFLDQPTVEVNFSPACLLSLPSLPPPLPCTFSLSLIFSAPHVSSLSLSNGLYSYFLSNAVVMSDNTLLSSVCGTCLSAYVYMPLRRHYVPCFYSKRLLEIKILLDRCTLD